MQARMESFCLRTASPSHTDTKKSAMKGRNSSALERATPAMMSRMVEWQDWRLERTANTRLFTTSPWSYPGARSRSRAAAATTVLALELCSRGHEAFSSSRKSSGTRSPLSLAPSPSAPSAEPPFSAAGAGASSAAASSASGLPSSPCPSPASEKKSSRLGAGFMGDCGLGAAAGAAPAAGGLSGGGAHAIVAGSLKYVRA
mmetsp:Transcript_30205/g.84386  ORF Transcript_30205/g.84386 Transcript_30205/m.84386 type:complete len:201 (-) Transcript_30205:671-1273(-)